MTKPRLFKGELALLFCAVAVLFFLFGFFACRQYLLSLPFVPLDEPVPAQAQTAGTAAASEKVNINTAGAEALQTLPGIGPQRAADIIAWREEHGPFPVVEALTDVPGIGDALLENCIDLITVEE